MYLHVDASSGGRCVCLLVFKWDLKYNVLAAADDVFASNNDLSAAASNNDVCVGIQMVP